MGYSSGATGTATVTGCGSTLTNSNELYVGYYGVGTLAIEDSGQVSSTNSYLGRESGSTGSVTVTGNGSTWTNSGNLHVGYKGKGTLNVSKGGTVVVGGGIYSSLNSLSGNGTITANGGVVDADLVFDAAHGLKNSFSFRSGGTLAITPSEKNELGVGNQGTGTLRITDGVTVASSNGYLGYGAGSKGTATIRGEGSKWINSGSLYVGYSGTGSLTIEAGGQASNTEGYLGNIRGSSGSVRVTGSGSTWTNSGNLYIGTSGAGTLTIEAGGQVFNNSGYLGYFSTGTVTVTGNGSKWTTNGTLYVGYNSYGTLNIGSGVASNGIVMAPSVTFSAGSPGTCNLNGGILQAGSVDTRHSYNTATINWSDGAIRNYDASTDLTVSGDNSFTIKLAATGTHAFYIDAGRTGTVGAVLGDATTGGTLVKLGEGTLTLSGNNSYSGKTTIAAGTLSLGSTGVIYHSMIDVQSGATFDISAKSSSFSIPMLMGSGTVVGNLSIRGGIHAPGDSIGIETVKGNYSLLQCQLQIQLAGTTAGSGYDQVLQSGANAYGTALGGKLSLDWTGFSGSTDSTKLWIMKNDTAGALSGTFSNYANGASLGVHDGRSWWLYYGADAATGNLTGGNDVVISAVPEPATLTLLAIFAMGLGAVGWRRGR